MVKVMGFKLLNFLTICICDGIIRLIGASNRKSRSGRTWHSSIRSIRRNSKGTSNQESSGVTFESTVFVILRRHPRRDWSTFEGLMVIVDNRLLLVTCSVEFGLRRDLTSDVTARHLRHHYGFGTIVGRALDNF